MRKVSAIGLGIIVFLAIGCSDVVPGTVTEDSGVTPTPDTHTPSDTAAHPPGDTPTTPTPIAQLTVDTGVSDDAPGAGIAIQIFCTVEGLIEGQEAPATSWAIIDEPEGDLETEIDGDLVTFFNPGEVRIACTIDETGWTDPTPVLVKVAPGVAVQITTAVDPITLKAGDVGEVTCSGLDDYGNTIDSGWSVEVKPGGAAPGQAGGLVAAQMKVKALTVGTFEVSCVTETGVKDETPVVVTVVPGVPYRIVTLLGSETIPCGGKTSVSCRAEDKQGNEITDLPMSVALPTKLSLAGLDITGTLTGKYVVKCVPAALDWSAFKLDSAILEVLPGAPVTLALEVMPPKAYFATYEVVTVVVLAHDAWGNLVPDAEITPITVSPDQDYKANTETTFLFKEEGVYTLATALALDPQVTASIDVAIEGEPPSVVVTHPPRGATIAGAKPSVTVEGIAQDKIAGIEKVLVNGKEATINADGSFSQIMIPVWGLNLLVVEAIDGSGASTKVKQSFYFAETYYPIEPSPSLVPDAFKLWISEEFIDDGVHNPNHVDDLATILEVMLLDLDLSGALSSQDIGAGYSLHMNNLSFNPPKVSLKPMTGGLHMKLEVKNLYLGVKLKGVCKVFGIDLCPDFSGSVKVTKATIHADFFVSASKGVTNSYLGNVSVSLDNLDLDVNGILGWLFDWLIDFVVGFFVEDVEDAFEGAVKDEMGDLIGGLFEELAFSETFELDGLFPGMEPVSLTFDTSIWSAAFTPKGGHIGLAGTFLATKKVPQKVLGAIARGTCLKGYPVNYQLPGQQEFEVGLFDDFLNLALSAAWMTGALNLVMDKEMISGDGDIAFGGLPVDDLSLALTFLLPPIVNGCNPDGIIMFQIGDLFLDAELHSFLFEGGVGKIGTYVTLELSVEFILVEGDDGPQISVMVNGLETIEFHWEYVPIEFVGNEDVLEDLLKEQLVDELLSELVGESLGEFEIPEIDLGSILNPDGAGVAIKPTIDAFSRVGGHTIVQGYLE